MKIESYSFPKSSFLAVEKDLGLLIDLFLKNDRLKKLLYYDTPDALKQPNISMEKSIKMLGKQIKIVPKIKVDYEELCYVIISFDNFSQNATNPAFRNSVIHFDILCHINQWQLNDMQLRPYKIAAEIDSMLRNKRLTGIGTVEFMNAAETVSSDEFAGLTLLYQIIHGYDGEDSKFAENPKEQQDINNNWNQLFNQSNGL